MTVYHLNAKRVERAGLSMPYKLESSEWTVSDPTIAGAAVVDSSKCRLRAGVVECG